MKSTNREIIFLTLYLILFASLFFLALYDYHRGESLVSFGFDPGLTNIMIMALSFMGVIKTIYHIYRFEVKG